MIRVGELTRDAVLTFKEWGAHENPLFFDYNYGSFDEIAYLEWYRTRNSFFKHYYGIYKDERYIGFLAEKCKNPITKSAVLGIVLDPNMLSKGYGGEALSMFLRDYFDRGMHTMKLSVSAHNARALSLYQKLGFVLTRRSFRFIPMTKKDWEHPSVVEARPFLTRTPFGTIERVYHMKLTREHFKEVQDGVFH